MVAVLFCFDWILARTRSVEFLACNLFFDEEMKIGD